MKPDVLRILSISDIHLGHTQTSTAHILENLERELPSQAWMQDVDMIIIAGDLFDRLLPFNSQDAFLIKRWMRRFLKMCARYDIQIYLLEGTSSHDHRQNQWFVEAQDDIPAYLRYIDRLMIERNERFGIDILFIPDEWRGNDTDATWKDVTKALQDQGLTQVDFTVIHGTMDYQMPPGLGVPMHVTQRYLDITRHYVISGHIHQSAHRDRALSNGSFDRLCHGDESPKGFWDLTIRKNGQNEIVFRENRGAKLYRTLDLREADTAYMEPIIQALGKDTATKLPEGSHVRLFVRKDSPALAAFDGIKKYYPQYHWTVKTDRAEDTQRALFQDRRGQFKQTNFTRDNLPLILMQRIRERYTDPALIARCEQELAEYLA